MSNLELLTSVIEEKLMPLLAQQTCILLEQSQDELKQVSWSDSEANTDSGFSIIAITKCREAFENLKTDLEEVKDLEIEFTKVTDINIRFYTDYFEYHTKIELKSGKGENDVSIPGSTIKTLDVDQWVIFCLRSVDKNKSFQFRYGRYYIGLSAQEFALFQDRSPRPHLRWSKFTPSNQSATTERSNKNLATQEWIKDYAEAAINRVLTGKKSSWQDFLVIEILKIAYSNQQLKNMYEQRKDIKGD